LVADPALHTVAAGGDFTVVASATRKRFVSFDVTPGGRTEDAPASPSDYVASYNFDTTIADGTFDDGSGHGHVLRAVVRNGATITMSPHETGQALTFPPKCTG